MRRICGRAVVCALAAFLFGCATPVLPVAEVRQANAAYDALVAAGTPLLDELAVAERQAAATAAQDASRTLTEGDVTVFLSFDAKDAASFASIGEPVGAAAQRRGLRLVGAYFDVLEVLAEGRNIDEAKSRLQGVASSMAGLAALATGGAAGTAGAAGALREASSALVRPLLTALGPLITNAAQAENAAELRRLVLEGAKPVDELIARLIDSTPQIYGVLILGPEAAATGPLLENSAARRAELQKIAGYHVAVANYTMLLTQLRVTLQALVSAVQSPNPVTLSSVAVTANELLLQAEAVRRAYAIFRSSRAGATMGVTP